MIHDDLSDKAAKLEKVLENVRVDETVFPKTYTEALKQWGTAAFQGSTGLTIAEYQEANPGMFAYWLCGRLIEIGEHMLKGLKAAAVQVTGDPHAGCALNADGRCDHKEVVEGPFPYRPPLVALLDNKLEIYISEVIGWGESRDRDTWARVRVMSGEEFDKIILSPDHQSMLTRPVDPANPKRVRVDSYLDGPGIASINLSRMLACWPMLAPDPKSTPSGHSG